MTIKERFEAKVDRSGGPDACHVWTGSKGNYGYGQLRVMCGGRARGMILRAHRMALEWALGEPIPYHLMVLHKCDNPPCANPLHLSIGTQKDNMSDAALKGRLSGRRTGAPKGSQNGHAKLTDEQVLAIRASKTPYLFGRTLGITKGTIHGIVAGNTWKHLPAETSWKPMKRHERTGANHSSKAGAKS